MAIYHLNLSRGTKGNGKYGGKSALAKFNYIIRDDKYIKGKEEILTYIKGKEEIPAIKYGYLPNFAKDNPATFWEATDNYEANNGILFRQLEVALPRELNAEQQQELCQQFAEAVCGKYHLPYTYAIHRGEFDHRGNKTKAEPTPHFHLIFSERANDETERKKRTAKNYFQRKGGAKKVRELQTRDWLISHRKLWADLANQALEKAGFSERIDHRSLLEQGITDREPQKKKHWRDNQSQIMPSIYETVRELREDKNKFDNLQIEINKALQKLEIETKKQEEAEAKKKAETQAIFDEFYKRINGNSDEIEKNKKEETPKPKQTDKKDNIKPIQDDLETKKNKFLEEKFNYWKQEFTVISKHEPEQIAQENIKSFLEKEYKKGGEEGVNKYLVNLIFFTRKYQEDYERYMRNKERREKEKAEAEARRKAEELAREQEKAEAEAKRKAEESLNLAKNNSYQQIYQTLIDFGLDIEANKNWLEDVKNNISMKENEKDVEKQTKQYIDLVKEEVQKVQKAAFAEFEAQITKGWEEEDYIPRPIGEMPISAIENYNYNDENFNNYEEIEEQQNEEISEDLLTRFNDLINNILQNQNQLNQNNLLIQNSSNISNQTEILENQPQQQEKKLLPNLSSYSNHLEKVGQKMFEALGGDEEKYKKPDLTNLPKVIKEAKEQGFSIDENALYTMQEEINKGKKYTALGIAEMFSKAVLSKSKNDVKTQDYVKKQDYVK